MKDNYKREVHPFIQRLKAIKYILSHRNFILITKIEEFGEGDKSGRRLTVLRRTDYGGDSDRLSCLGGAKICEKQDYNELQEYEF